jgi:hypothetical protein
MQTDVMFLDCPAYMDGQRAVRCGLPAAAEYWYTVESSSGPLESAKIRCPRGHGFNGPVEDLTVPAVASRHAAARHRVPPTGPENDTPVRRLQGLAPPGQVLVSFRPRAR